MKLTNLALVTLSVLSISTAALACGEVDTSRPDGTIELSGQNMECVSSAKDNMKISMEYSWGACLASQTALISKNGQTMKYFVNSARGETPRHDELRGKPLKNDGYLMLFKGEKAKKVEAKLSLTRDPKNDGKGKDWMDREVTLSAYTAVLEMNGVKTNFLCRELAQRH